MNVTKNPILAAIAFHRTKTTRVPIIPHMHSTNISQDEIEKGKRLKAEKLGKRELEQEILRCSLLRLFRSLLLRLESLALGLIIVPSETVSRGIGIGGIARCSRC